MELVLVSNLVVGLVVEIFVCNYGFDIGVILVGCGFWIGEYVFVVEDVEIFVFYCVYVEVGDCDDVEFFKIVFLFKYIFVLVYGLFEGFYGLFVYFFIVVFDIDIEIDG